MKKFNKEVWAEHTAYNDYYRYQYDNVYYLSFFSTRNNFVIVSNAPYYRTGNQIIIQGKKAYEKF
jgi:hypothetical protein